MINTNVNDGEFGEAYRMETQTRNKRTKAFLNAYVEKLTPKTVSYRDYELAHLLLDRIKESERFQQLQVQAPTATV